MPPALLFAQISWQPGHEEYAAIFILCGLSFLVSMGSGVATIWGVFRRQPSIEEELKSYAKSQDVKDLERRIITSIDSFKKERREDITELKTTVENFGSTLNNSLGDMQRAVGRLEGKIEGMASK